jgi:16S rRNA (cytosine967-C5)-methyltransferase
VDRPFDRILVDAPCSGLGVLRRHPEGKWQKRAERLPELRAGQLAILERVAPLLRPGGVLVYSTCSTEPEENEQVIERFCARRAEFQRETVAPWLPANARTLLTTQGDLSTMTASFPQAFRDRPGFAPMDCFFAARLRKAERT